MNLFDFPSWCVMVTFFLITRVSKGTYFDLKPSVEQYLPNYDFYHNLTRMNECLHHISAQNSEFIDVQMRYRSRLGLSQYVVRITNFSLDSSHENKPDRRSRIFLSYGEHASEFFPVQSMFHLLNNITEGFDLPPGSYGGNFSRFLLNNFDLYILAVVNPDGRAIIERTRNFCWRGTANNVDLNSDLEGDSGKRRTVRVIAEPECRVIRELTSKKKFDAFISFHSGKRQIVFPAIGKHPRVSGTDLFYLASLISSSLKSDLTLVPVNNTVGGESIFSYSTEEKQIPFTYKMFLWGSEEMQSTTPEQNCFSTFNPPSESLQAELEVVHHLYPTLFDFIHHWKEIELNTAAELEKYSYKVDNSRGMSYSMRLFFFIMGCTIILLLCNIRVPFKWKMFYRRQRRIVSFRSLGTLFTVLLIP